MLRRRLVLGACALGLSLVAPGAALAGAASVRLIAVSIDFGTGAGAPHALVRCVHEAPGATDAQALDDALAAASLPAATFASSGLLCSIGGYPAQGCGTPTSTGYRYWAYFHGTPTSWAYANNGPAEQIATPTLSEGWRFEDDGKGNPSDPPPSSSSSSALLCAAVTPTTTTIPVSPTTSAPTETTTTVRGVVVPMTQTTSAHLKDAPTHLAPRSHATTTTKAPAAALGSVSHPGSGPPIGAIVALAVIILSGGAGAILWRTRRS